MTKAWPKPSLQNLPDQVAQTILQRISSGELPPGSRLPSQRELAERMGVGLAVVREAVQHLAALNVLEANHGSGTIVRPFRWMPLIYDPTLFLLAAQRFGVRELWECRRLLEGQVIRLAVERATEDDLSAMQAVLRAADPLPVNYAASQSLNREFHMALARAAHNSVMEDLLAPLLEVRTHGAERRFTREHCRLKWKSHQAIYDAIESQDMKAADKAISRHFDEVGTVALAEFEEGPAKAAVLRQRHNPGAKGRRRRSTK